MKCTKGLSLLIIFVFIAPSLSYGELIISGHESYPPITWKTKKGNKSTLTGVTIELITTILKELNVPHRVKYVGNWSRVQKEAKKGKVDIITGIYINDERKTYMNYTEPYLKDPVVVFVKKGNVFPFTKWDDLKGKSGATPQGESYGQKFDVYMEKNLKIQKVRKVEYNYNILLKGRKDYFIFGLYPGMAIAVRDGHKDKVEVLPNRILEEKFYFSVSKKSKYIYLIPKINEKIKQRVASGFVKGLIPKYDKIYEQDIKK